MFGRKSTVWRTFTDRDAEHLCGGIMRDALGYTDAAVTMRSGDGGLDVVSKGAVAQVKYQSAPVGRPAIQNLAGAAMTSPGKERLFFSFSRYTQGAIAYANQVGIALFVYDTQGGFVGVNGIAANAGTRKAKKKRSKPQPGSAEHQAQVEENFRIAWGIISGIARWFWFMARELSRVVAASWGTSGRHFPPPEKVTYRRATFAFLVLTIWGLVGAGQNTEPPENVVGIWIGFGIAVFCFGYFVYSAKQWWDLTRKQRAASSEA